VSGRHRYVITEEILKFIKDCLSEDEEEDIKKQVHTAKRIYDRLVEKKHFTGGESTVREVVAALKRKTAEGILFHSHMIPVKQYKLTGGKP